MNLPLLENRPLPAGRSEDNEYPDDNGEPMSENTLQFEWIVLVKLNLEAVFADRDDVFVAGDLLWYPVKGSPEIRCAPDVLVAFGRPKGYRGSYKQWVEADVPPTVVFEILSPGNRDAEMELKLAFYERHGVEEYYLYDPIRNELSGWRRNDEVLEAITAMDGWTSPRLGVRFELGADELRLYRPNGEPFCTFADVEQKTREAEQEKEAALRRVQEQADEIAQLRQRLKMLGEAADE